MNLFGEKATEAPTGASKAKKLDLKGKKLIAYVKKTPKPKGLQMGTGKAWKTEHAYHKNAVVSLEGVTYKSKVHNNKNTPSPTSEDWTVVK